MNEYKLTYTKDGKSDTLTARKIDRTESSARKAFLKECKERGIDAEVVSIELICENACATKQQERDTLEAIKKMVAELGPQSYLATAFEGAFEDAESNIDNDFGDSMKRRWEYSEAQLKTAQGDIKQLKKQIEKTELTNRDLRLAIGKAKEEASVTINALRSRVLPDWLYENLWTLVTDEAAKARQGMAVAAEAMASYADCPTDIAFTSAVESYRRDKKKAEHCEKLAEDLDAIAEEGTK